MKNMIKAAPHTASVANKINGNARPGLTANS
jgi:hypothetical protein